MESTLASWAPRVLSLLRFMSALLLLQHGTTKILSFPDSPMAGIGVSSLGGLAGVFELVGGLLLAVGLFTRSVAFVLSGVMAAAYFIAHAPQGFYPLTNGGELAALYCFVFFFLIFAGPGPISVDEMLKRERAR